MFSFSKKPQLIVLYMNWIGQSDHEATLESFDIGKKVYLINSPNGREKSNHEMQLGYIFENIFKYIKQGKRYDCIVENGKIIKINHHSKKSRFQLYSKYFPLPNVLFNIIDEFAFLN